MEASVRAAQAQGYVASCLERMKTRPVPAGQKFAPGTRVHIAADLGIYMSHFVADKDATVCYTYAHAFDGNNIKSYCLDVDGIGEISWYEEWQLTAI